MTELTVLVPVLGRPHRVAPILDSALAWTPDAEVLFIADPDDTEELVELEAQGASWITVDGGYAKKIHEGVAQTDAPLIFTGADDLLFHPGWFETAKARLVDGIQVVGVNDLRHRAKPEQATHFLMTREYANLPCVDDTPGPFFQGYVHNYCDRELVDTAKNRNAYAFASASHVEHLHHLDGKAPLDDTYLKGNESFRRDTLTFRERSRMWGR